MFIAAFLCVAAGIAAAQSSDSGSTNGTVSADLLEIPECTFNQLNAAETVLTTDSNALQCEKRLGIQSGMLLQSADAADDLCDYPICLNALRQLYFSLPNCRYELWGLKFSASKLLDHCGIATNATSTA